MEPLEHVVYKLRNATVNLYPFPHFFIEEIFPEDFYFNLIRNLPPDDRYKKTESAYKHRSFGPKDFDPTGFLDERRFLDAVLSVFKSQLVERKEKCFLPGESFQVSTDVRLIRDESGYKIGPHTDAPWKMVSLLFYLPETYSLYHTGTSIFVPKDREFKCKGGPHYPFEGFDEIYRAPFLPNSCFGFWKTDDSWHGVKPIVTSCDRDVLLYNIYTKPPKE